MCIKAKWIRGRSVFSILFVVFLIPVYSCSLLIPLLLNRFNAVVVNGHDSIEMWIIGPADYTKRAMRPSDWNSKRLSYRTSVAREETSDSIQIIEAAAELTLQ